MVAVHESRAWPKHRELELPQSPWPAGTSIVSADSHLLEAFDWADYVPAKYRDRAPKSHWDETGFHLSADGRSLDSHGFPSEMMMGRPGARDVHLRIKDMDAEGISKDVLFPQLCYALIGNDDHDFVNACFRGYNELVMDHVKPYRDRLFPVGLIPFWDEASVREGGAQLKDLGFKAMIMPTVPARRLLQQPRARGPLGRRRGDRPAPLLPRRRKFRRPRPGRPRRHRRRRLRAASATSGPSSPSPASSSATPACASSSPKAASAGSPPASSTPTRSTRPSSPK